MTQYPVKPRMNVIRLNDIIKHTIVLRLGSVLVLTTSIVFQPMYSNVERVLWALLQSLD